MKIIRKLFSSSSSFSTGHTRSLDLIIHIGSPKAGSSALQSFMLRSRKEIEKIGYYYPEHNIDKNGVSGGHSQLWVALREGDVEGAKALLETWLNHARKKGLILVVSSESFFNQSESLAKLFHESLRIPPHVIRIIAFVRAPVDYLLGNHNQGIKRHGQSWSLSSHLAPVLRNSKPSSLSGGPLLQWADAFGDDNCHFLTYQKPAEDTRQIEAVFLEELGVPASEILALLPERKITNRSYVRSALELKRTLNTVLAKLPPKVGRQIDWALQEYSDLHPDEGSVGSQDIPAVLYRDINAKFLAAMEPALKRFPSLDRKVLFPPQPTKDTFTVSDATPYRPLAYLEEQYPKELDIIRKAALTQYKEGDQSYAFLKLLDLLGIYFEEPVALKGLSARTRGIIASSRMKEADRLRELGAYFEQQGLLDDALLLLEKALETRPEGGGIKKMQRRVADKKLLLEQMNDSDASGDDITAH
ncbi:hypothetical protein [Cobetia sp. QF-1]|uniref:hypothetical protein n=1 Tax=Cobetia sp. QF-1 TaxID=1969833 RepID=UPI001130C9F6|nr:hypothetical protein [Cobetia sp. QF-1]